jgi:rare lipoprotein A
MTYRRILILTMLAFAALLPEAFAQVKLGKMETGNASYYSARFHGKKNLIRGNTQKQ